MVTNYCYDCCISIFCWVWKVRYVTAEDLDVTHQATLKVSNPNPNPNLKGYFNNSNNDFNTNYV